MTSMVTYVNVRCLSLLSDNFDASPDLDGPESSWWWEGLRGGRRPRGDTTHKFGVWKRNNSTVMLPMLEIPNSPVRNLR